MAYTSLAPHLIAQFRPDYQADQRPLNEVVTETMKSGACTDCAP